MIRAQFTKNDDNSLQAPLNYGFAGGNSTCPPCFEAFCGGIGSLDGDLDGESHQREDADTESFVGKRCRRGEEDAREEHENDEPLPVEEIGRRHLESREEESEQKRFSRLQNLSLTGERRKGLARVKH